MRQMAKASARGRILKIVFSFFLALALGLGLYRFISPERMAAGTSAVENAPAVPSQLGKTNQISESNAATSEPLSAQLTRSVLAEAAMEERNMLEARELVAGAPAGGGEIQSEVADSLRLQKQEEGEVMANGEDLY